MIKIKSLDAKDKNTLKVNKCQCHKVDKATTKTKSSTNLCTQLLCMISYCLCILHLTWISNTRLRGRKLYVDRLNTIFYTDQSKHVDQ
jgi:hypothetical protein